MKKISLLASAVCTLILFGCSPSVDGGKGVTYKEKSNLLIDGNEIAFSSMVVIPGGTVEGGESNVINNYDGVFYPEGRNLKIPAFEMGQYEVTQRLYKAVMSDDTESDAEPSECQSKNSDYVYSDLNTDEKDLRPVENVSWFDAVYFCNKLSAKTGKKLYYNITGIERDENKHIVNAVVTINETENGYRLPTEAEWEYAARGADTYSKEWSYFFAGSASSSKEDVNSALDIAGWYCYNNVNGATGNGKAYPYPENIGYGTHRVGLKSPVSDTKKLYDMSGNVLEWCWDWFNKIDATTPLSGPENYNNTHPVRGGYWKSMAYMCSVAYRDYHFPFFHDKTVGFRVVCSAQ